MVTKTFNILTKISASEELWGRIDKFINDVASADIDKEVDYIGFSMSDVKDGVLDNDAILYIGGKDFPSFDLQDKVEYHVLPEWDRNDLLPSDIVYLYVREGC